MAASAPPTIRAVLDRRNLELAWQQVRPNRGAPGVDEVTVARWERHWQENLDRLAHQVRTNTYHPEAGRPLTYQKVFEVQARALRRCIERGEPSYQPFLVK